MIQYVLILVEIFKLIHQELIENDRGLGSQQYRL